MIFCGPFIDRLKWKDRRIEILELCNGFELSTVLMESGCRTIIWMRSINVARRTFTAELSR